MDDLRLGTRVRAVRLRLGWRQVDVAARAGVSQSTVCRVEHGRLETVQVGLVRRVLRALEIDLALDARWRGGELDRLADEDHAALVGRIAQVLEAAGWSVRAEVSYSIYGERGSIDLRAWHLGSRILLVVEVKTTLNSVEETLRRHDAKVRLAGVIAKERFGWEPTAVARLLALPDETTARRRVARHEAVLRRTYGLRAREVRRWLRDPMGGPGMLTFLSPIPAETGRWRRAQRPDPAPRMLPGHRWCRFAWSARPPVPGSMADGNAIGAGTVTGRRWQEPGGDGRNRATTGGTEGTRRHGVAGCATLGHADQSRVPRPSRRNSPVAKVTMPQLGESVAEGTIGRWLKQPGDAVARYEPLLEVITDKVNAEVPSPFAGILREILAPEGATVPNNAEIAVIETADDADGADAPGAPAPSAAPAVDLAAAPAATAATATTIAAATPSPTTAHPVAPASAAGANLEPDLLGDPNARMTPAVRRLLREHDLEPARVAGTGGGGRVTREDVLAHVEALRTGVAPAIPAGALPMAPTPPAARAPSAPSLAFPAGADEVLVPMSQMRKGIAAQMTRSLAAPHAYLQVEVDVAHLVALRERTKKAYQAKEGIGLSFVPFVVKACTEALKRNPTFNAHWTDQGLLAKRRINIGVAVAMDEGLIVPVVRDADLLSVHGLNMAITDVAGRARAGKLRLDDFGGGTFTVDNTGYLGTNLVMPILNVPEVGIVTMEAITKRAVVVSTPDGDVIAIRPVMNMVLGIDHRANDGAGGAALLRDIKAWLEAVGPDTAIY